MSSCQKQKMFVPSPAPVSVSETTVLLHTHKPHGEIVSIILKHTGYADPLIRICTRKGNLTSKTLVSVPPEVLEKLISTKAFKIPPKQYILRDTDFPTSPELSGKSIFIPLSGHSVAAVRSVILNTMTELESRGYLNGGGWKMTSPQEGSRKMFVTLFDVSPENAALIRLFLNDAFYETSDGFATIRAYWAKLSPV